MLFKASLRSVAIGCENVGQEIIKVSINAMEHYPLQEIAVKPVQVFRKCRTRLILVCSCLRTGSYPWLHSKYQCSREILHLASNGNVLKEK